MTEATQHGSVRVLVLEPGRAEQYYWRDLRAYPDLFAILAWRDCRRTTLSRAHVSCLKPRARAADSRRTTDGENNSRLEVCCTILRIVQPSIRYSACRETGSPEHRV
jgi:hypothetical protein